MASNAALDNVLNQAQEAAASFQPPAMSNVPVTVPTAANNNLPAAHRPTLEDFANNGGMQVDEFLQVKAEGFRIGKDMKGLLDEIVVELDMSEVVPIYSARGETGGNTTFIKSYDGATTPDGQNFQVAMQHLKTTSQKFNGPYPTAEIPMELVEDVKDPKTGSSVVIDAGTSVGLTPSITGFKNFQKFMKKLQKDDPSLLTATLKVKLTHEKRTNSNNNEWGVIGFELIEVL